MRSDSDLVSARKALIATWAVAGVAAFLGRALVRLVPIALEPIQNGRLETWLWVLLSAWVVFNAYAEGYRGFHRRFSPRVVARAMELGDKPKFWRVVLAAPYCMGLFQAPRRVLVSSWFVVFLIVAVVVLVRQIAQPWRGIIDAGVVVGLGAGLVSLLVHFARALRGQRHAA